jgi:hypothetical protein
MSVLRDLKVYVCGGVRAFAVCGYYSPSINRLNFGVSLWGEMDFFNA